MRCDLQSNCSAVNITGGLQERLTALKLQAEHVMAGIICHLSDHVRKTPQIITDAFRCVFTEAPSHLAWNPCPKSLGCWVADESSSSTVNQYYGDSDVYTVNLLTGTALCNGHAPSHLPASIVGHEVYQAVFPNMTFDVTAKVLGDQVTYRTVHAFYGCFYSWRLEGGRLHVTETCDGQALELLSCGPPVFSLD
jgi:hypothetical protein